VPKDTCWSLIGNNASNAFTIGNKSYVLSRMPFSTSTNILFEYDPVLDFWTQKASYPEFSWGESSAASLGTNAYIGFGIDSGGLCQHFYEYNSISNNWTPKADYPAPETRSPFIAGGAGEIIAGCGVDALLTITDDVWKYTPSTDSWSQVADFPHPAFSLQAESYNDEIYVPFPDTLSGTTELYKYNLVTNTWTQLSSCPQYMYYYASFSITGNIFVGMGMNLIPFPYNTNFWKYNIVSDSWQQVTSFPGTTNSGYLSFSVNNFGYIAFGETFGVPSPDVYQYIPDSTTALVELDEKDQFLVYPTVAHDKIFVESSHPSELRLMDMQGKSIDIPVSRNDDQKNIEIDISELVNGIYFLYNEKKSVKVIKI
jgi:N-acetylneuraminic acid mutarotase